MVAVLLALALQGHPVIAPGATLQKLADGFAFTEGPTADRQGNVYFTDQPNDRIVRWSVDGKVEDWLKPAGRANGLAFDHKGNLLACADEKNELWSISPDKKATVLIKDFGGSLLNGPNDVWVRPDNGAYLTDPLYARPYWKRSPMQQQAFQAVYFLTPDHKTLKPVEVGLKQPNGIVGTPDGKTLYVSDIGSGQTFRYRINKNGSLSDKTKFCDLGSDGMTMDDRGNVYLTGRGVTVFDPSGRQIEHIDVPEDWTANVEFGGKDHRLLFITASKAVYGMQMSVHGA